MAVARSREEDEHEQPRLNTDAPPYMGSERYGNVGHTRNDAELTDDDVFDAPVGAGAGGAGDRELDVFSSRDANLRVLQHRALNEVFIGETLSARCAFCLLLMRILYLYRHLRIEPLRSS